MDDDYPRFKPVPLDLTDTPLPLTRWEDGTIRVVNSRVQLEFLVWKFQRGESPEEIAESFETVELPDIYTIKGFYLRHQEAVDAYADEIERQGNETRKWFESRPGYEEFRQQLEEKMEAVREQRRAAAPR